MSLLWSFSFYYILPTLISKRLKLQYSGRSHLEDLLEQISYLIVFYFFSSKNSWVIRCARMQEWCGSTKSSYYIFLFGIVLAKVTMGAYMSSFISLSENETSWQTSWQKKKKTGFNLKPMFTLDNILWFWRNIYWNFMMFGSYSKKIIKIRQIFCP